MLKRFLYMMWPLLVAGGASGQCAYTCSNYIVSPLTYSFYEGDGQLVPLLDDDVSTTFPLGFLLDYYCTAYNQVRIASNGFITFDFGNINNAGTPYAQALPHPASPNAVIAWNWNDLDPSNTTGGGSITYTTIGVSPNQKFVVTYSAIPLWTISAPPASTVMNSGQIVIHEGSNLIEVHVKEANNNGWLTHTEGIEDQAGVNGTAVLNPPRNLTLWQANNSSHLFSPYSVAATVTVTGPATVCQGATVVYSANANPQPLSYNWMLPNGWTASSTSPTISAIAGASGNLSVSANYTCGACPPAFINVNVQPAPTVTVTSVSPTLGCAGTNLSVTATGALTFTLNPGGFAGGGTFLANIPASGVYSLSGTNSSGCKSLSNSTVQINVKPSPSVTVNSGNICLGQTFTFNPSGAFFYSYPNGSMQVTPQAAGIYTFQVGGTGTNGCQGQPVTSTVDVKPLPSVTASASRSLICRGESVELSVSGANSYLWLHNADSNTLTTAQPTAMTIYYVEGTGPNGCTKKTAAIVYVSSCAGLTEVSESSLCTVFPNPFSGRISLQCTRALPVQIVDLHGRVRAKFEVSQGDAELNLDYLNAGVYLLELGAGEDLKRLLIIKE
jgi:hypothetical protein